MAFTVDIRGNASHLERTLGLAKGRMLELGNAASMGATAIAGLGVAAAAGIGAFVISSSKAASNVESLTMQFETLLGGADAAGKRMEEIVKFAASTPFEIAELAATSKLLQTMGGTLLATGEGLRMVGDAAAISGQPLQEVGLHIGRLFNAITSGTSAGESVARLQELGLMTGTVKREFEALAASQKKGTSASLTQEQAMAKLRDVFKSTDGAMERLANTTEGKLSNLGDNITQLKVAFGTGFNDGLKVALDATNNFLPQLESKFSEAGQMIGGAISQAVQGNTAELAAVGAFMGEVVFAGFKAVYLKGMEELIASSNANLSSFTPTGLAENIGRKMSGGNFTPDAKTSSMAEYMQAAMVDVGESENLKMLQSNAFNRRMNGVFDEGAKGQVKNEVKDGVKEGMREVWYSLETGAKFSN